MATIGYEPKMGTLVLSRGSSFSFTSFVKNGTYPDGTTAHIIFTDAAGATLANFAGDVQLNRIVFNETVTDTIPQGSNFELFVSLPDGFTFKTDFGTVIRKEVTWPLVTVVNPEDTQAQYTANFLGQYIGPMWRPMVNSGSLSVHLWPLLSQDPTMGPDVSFFTTACARWLWPMHSDSVTIIVKVVNGGAGKFNVLVCGDYEMNNYLGIQFETGIVNNKLHVITGDSALTWTYRGAAVNRTTSNGDVYRIIYNQLANSIACYKWDDLTPLISWTDTTNIVPHGEGFRYTGLSWNTSLFTPGVEPTAWEARDGA